MNQRRKPRNVPKQLRENQIQNLEVRFNKIDRNHDGRITKDEFELELLENGLPPSLVNSFIGLYDTNGDGWVSKQEYINAFSKFDVLHRQASVEERG